MKNYYLLKSRTPKALCSNVIYKFIGSCDKNTTYIDMSSRHLITRVRKHLNFKSIQESAIKNYILSCDSCSNVKFDLNNFSILRRCTVNQNFTLEYGATTIDRTTLDQNDI